MNDAEFLLSAADDLHRHPGLLIAPRGVKTEFLGRLAFALELENRPGLALRAMIEGWPLDRIVREVR